MVSENKDQAGDDAPVLELNERQGATREGSGDEAGFEVGDGGGFSDTDDDFEDESFEDGFDDDDSGYF